MAPMCLNGLQLVSLTILLLLFCRVVGHHECSPRWDLNVGGLIPNFTVWVEQDQVYSIKSPLLYRLTYPRSSLMTWYLQTADTSTMSMIIYVLYMKTDGYCDVLGVFTFDDHPNSQGYRYEQAVTYWSGSFDYGYDYFKNEERFMAVEFVESRYAILQFKTGEYYADIGFVLRVLPLLHAGHVIEADHGNHMFIANSIVQQLSLYPGSLNQDTVVTPLTIQAEKIWMRVFATVAFMNINNQEDCTNSFIEFWDESNEGVLLMKACRNMTISSPIQVVSVTSSLTIKYVCNTMQILNVKNQRYEVSPCAILQYQFYEPEKHGEKTYMQYPERILEINHVDFHKLTEFNGVYLLFGVKVEGGQWGFHFYMFLQSEKYELHDETVMLKFSKYGSLGRVSLTYKPFGETGRESVFETESKQLNEGNEFQTFWLTVEYNKLSVGTGFEPRKNVRLTSFINGELDLKYFKVYGDNTTVFRVYEDCDETLKRYNLPQAPDTIYHSVSVGSIYTRSWIYQKEYPDQIVVFRIISSLLSTPDCEWESVTIYRGACVSWRRKVAIICGNMEEIHSETTHLHVLIQFQSRADIVADQKFNGASARFFEIEYKVVKRGPTTLKAVLNVGFFLAIFLSGMIVLLVVAVIFCVKIKKKKQAPRVAAQTISPGHPVQKTGQPIQVNISIDNKGQVVGVPDTVYHGGEVKTDITYTGIPPPPVYEPPKRLYQDTSHFSGQIQPVQPALPGTH